MTSHITVPWFDPMELIDGFCRLVIAPEIVDLVMLAQTSHGMCSVGTTRMAWLRAVEPAGGTATVVPWLKLEPQPRLVWRALDLADLPAWLKRLSDHGFDATLVGNVRTFQRMHEQLINRELVPSITETQRYPGADGRAPRAMLVRQRYHFEALQMFVAAVMHPRSPHADEPLVLAQLISQERAAALLAVETRETFLPFIAYNTAMQAVRLSHIDSSGHARARSGWRQQQRHGLKPHAQFYGKTSVTAGTGLYAGIEMEMELPSHDVRQHMMRTLYAVCDEFTPVTEPAYRERLHVESDSSLNQYGLEVVLMPHEVHSFHGEQFWRRIWQAACAAGASNTGGRAGMHIHVSANAALRPPPTGVPCSNDEYSDTVGLLIDLVTGMLAGGPAWRYNPNGVNVKSVVFGRPTDWGGSFGQPNFSLMCPRPGLSWERYRHVNWNNTKTIEFRIFGPRGFQAVFDWLNIATQLASAIVQFSRALATHLITLGASRGTGVAFYEALPDWLRPMLVLDAHSVTGSVREWALPLSGGRIAIRAQAGRPYLIGLPYTSHNSGTGGIEAERRRANYIDFWQAETTRGAHIHESVLGLWRAFTRYLDHTCPQFDLLHGYLKDQVLPQVLPEGYAGTRAEMQAPVTPAFEAQYLNQFPQLVRPAEPPPAEITPSQTMRITDAPVRSRLHLDPRSNLTPEQRSNILDEFIEAQRAGRVPSRRTTDWAERLNQRAVELFEVEQPGAYNFDRPATPEEQQRLLAMMESDTSILEARMAATVDERAQPPRAQPEMTEDGEVPMQHPPTPAPPRRRRRRTRAEIAAANLAAGLQADGTPPPRTSEQIIREEIRRANENVPPRNPNNPNQQSI